MIERKMERKENQIERVKKRENKIMVFKQPKKRKKEKRLNQTESIYLPRIHWNET